jgi:hypothetical protein
VQVGFWIISVKFGRFYPRFVDRASPAGASWWTASKPDRDGVKPMKSKPRTIRALGVFLGLACHLSAAQAVPFTWDLSAIVGPVVTADTMSSTDYLLNEGDPAGNGVESFILEINGFQNNGTDVTPAGLGSSYGIYLYGDVAIAANGTPGGLYTNINISLIGDPGNLDGIPSATPPTNSSRGSLSFPNTGPTGAADDITLATGTLISGAFGIQPNGNPGTHFVETFIADQPGFVLSPLASDLAIEEFLYNTSTSRVAGALSDGSTWITVNDGFGTEDLLVPEPRSLMIFIGGLLALALIRCIGYRVG